MHILLINFKALRFTILALNFNAECLFTAQTENEKDDGGIVIVPLEYQHPVGLFPRFNRPQFQEQRVAVDGPSFFNPFADVIQNLEGKSLFTYFNNDVIN